MTLIDILKVLLDVVWWIVVVQIVLSLLISFNVVNFSSDFVRSLYNGLNRLTDPLYRPIRRVLPDFGQFDFAPAVVLLILVCLNIVLDHVALTLQTGAPL